VRWWCFGTAGWRIPRGARHKMCTIPRPREGGAGTRILPHFPSFPQASRRREPSCARRIRRKWSIRNNGVVTTMIRRHFRIGLAIAAITAAFAASAATEPEFTLAPTVIHIPERGDVPGMTVLTENYRFNFILPMEWRMSSTTPERKLTFEARDFKGTMTVKIIPGPTNALDVQTLRDELANRFPGARIA